VVGNDGYLHTSGLARCGRDLDHAFLRSRIGHHRVYAVINDPAFFDLAGPGIEGLVITAWLPAHDDLCNPKIVEYQDFMKKYAPDEPLGGFSLAALAYTQPMVEGLESAGRDLTRESFMQALDSLQNYTGSVVPRISWSPTDHAGVRGAFFQQAQNGQWVTITDWVSLNP
jgi:branched-chain amino acid transport system substrate-binding protein